MQKCAKMLPRTSSVVISPPVISARWKRASRMSWATKSAGIFICRPSMTRWIESRAWVRAS